MQGQAVYQTTIVLPTGATTGRRIILDAETGIITMYDDDDNKVAEISADVGYKTWEYSGPVPSNPTVAKLQGPQLQLGNELNGYSTYYQDWEIVFDDLASGVACFISRLGNNLRLRAAGSSAYINCQSFLRYSGEGWNTLTLPTGWTASIPCQYRRYPTGIVALRGIVNAVPNPIPGGTTIGPLPVGYRPVQNELFVNGYDSSGTKGRLIVRAASGLIEIYDAPNDLPSLSGVSFDTVL